MTRRTRTELENELLSPVGGGGASELSKAPDWLTSEVDALLEGWTPSERTLLEELVEDAGSEVQREMIHRVVVARHTAAEVHAFADEIRGIKDDALYALCTVNPLVENISVTTRFRAEADPLFAMELNGRIVSPRLEDDPGPVYGVDDGRPRPRFAAPPALLIQDFPRVGPPPRSSFEGESSSARARPLSTRELGDSAEDRPSRKGEKLAEKPNVGASSDSVNEAVKSLGLSYREHLVDGGDVTLERALELASQSLQKGIPIPVTLGREPKERGRQVLMLQVTPPGKTRAFQLHDPFANETVWANEKDLLGRHELPFDNKIWRRITAVSLPLPPKKR